VEGHVNKVIILLIIGMLSLLPVITAQDVPEQPPPIPCDSSVDHVAQAQAAHDDNDLHTAIGHYTCAIEFDAENATLYGARGIAYALSGDLVAAVNDYQTYEDLTGMLSPFMQQLIDRVFVTEQNTPPFDFAAQSVAPTDAEGYYQRGLAFQRSGAIERAILDFNSAISIAQDNPLYYGARGMAYMAYGLPDSALSDFERYQTLTGRLTPFMQQYMTAQEDSVVFPVQAADPVAPEVTTGDAQSYYERGLFFQTQGLLDRAIIDFNVAIGLMPDNATFYAVRGLAFVAYDEPELALRDYERYETLTGTLAPFMVQQIPALEALIAEEEAEISE
jgi:tetratricopeptide (TPR) repeat protein